MSNNSSFYQPSSNAQASKASLDILTNAISILLETSSGFISEYELIKQLNHQGLHLPTSGSSLSLFRSHFLVYHVLYQLQNRYWENTQQFLEISALKIQLHERITNQNHSLSLFSDDEKLRSYYLNLQNIDNENNESVDDLLNQFWEKVVKGSISECDLKKALALFEIEMPLTLKKVKERYRQLAMLHHPERGGCAEKFQYSLWAFGILQKHLQEKS